ncbi:MAG: hypothetical protein AAGF31_12760 [Planctomycetota bacterium]
MSLYATVELEASGHQSLPADMDPENRGLVYGQCLGQCGEMQVLDQYASDAGAKPLSSFLDESDILDEEEYEEMGIEPPDENWADIPDGIQTLEAVLRGLEQRSADNPIGRYPVDALQWDIKAMLHILRNAPDPDDCFRITVG